MRRHSAASKVPRIALRYGRKVLACGGRYAYGIETAQMKEQGVVKGQHLDSNYTSTNNIPGSTSQYENAPYLRQESGGTETEKRVEEVCSTGVTAVR